ncbi:Methyltransferase domain-containing protein [Psychroflexus salarius]|uniref:Methyltransferase domain-containing protein n=1 Tax=Psychroflexus salarius TaxID=1155689 RepID=A0A1M4TZY8_9FLAO|nr:class I SAM-dependent methyltransferase [Psychroflexus salarius]SHE49963.1 Methyltransferase domain-containing protein [Psychroflexus salarius]
MKKIFKHILNTVPRPLLIKISKIIKPLIPLFYYGNKYEDPIDGKTFRSFLPYGYNKIRDNVLSPSTLSLERHRLLWLYLKNETDLLTRKQSLLHFAPEQAFYKKFKKLNHLEYVTTDLESPLADVKADICNLPFDNNSFDFILCNHVLEHINNDTKAMQELFRVLKSGGTAILQIPIDEKKVKTYSDDTITDKKRRDEIFGQYDHVRIYGQDYYDKLKSIGFEVEAVRYAKKLGQNQIDRFRINKNEAIPVCKKPI